MTATPFFEIKSKISSVFILIICDDVWLLFVTIGICQPNHDLALTPKSISVPDKSEHETCSPDASSTSNSLSSKFFTN